MLVKQDAALAVEDLSLELRTPNGPLAALRNVSFEVPRGKTLGIVGESGSGKSLTAMSIMGLQPASAIRTAARLDLGGLDLLGMSERDLAYQIRGRRIGMIFQEPMTSLNPVYTIRRQMVETMTLHRTASVREAEERAVYLLERVGISGAKGRLGQHPHQFSGGQRQRIMIAMALMNGPALIIADEPTTALDVTIQAQTLRLLRELQAEFQMSMILITHDLGIVSRMADSIAVMYAGEIVEYGPADDVLRHPRHPYTAGLLSCLPGAGNTGRTARLGSIPGLVPSLLRPAPGCAFVNRCPLAHHACNAQRPSDQWASATHRHRCNLPDAVLRDQRRAFQPPAPVVNQPQATTASGPVLKAEGVWKTFKVRNGVLGRARLLNAVRGVSLEVAPGETLAIVGESGCGKSTLARMLLGLEAPTSGAVAIDGKPIDSFGRKALARAVQPIFQDPYSSLNPRRTVGGAIRRPLDVHAVGTPQERERAVADMMEKVGLPRRLYYNYPSQLSGGQRQRVAIARALIAKPSILICDEPTSALDVSVQAQILNLLSDLGEEFGLTYIVISHDLAVVRHIATRIAVMYLGEIVELAPGAELFAEPKHPYTRSLLASVMTVKPGAPVPDNQMKGRIADPLDLPEGCAFHPRCPHAMDVCRTDSPRLAGGRAVVRCHLYDGRTEGVELARSEPMPIS